MNPEDMLTRIFLRPDNLTLTPEQVSWATALARQTGQQWQTYRMALALLGIQEWFQERAPRLNFSSDWLPQGDLSAFPRPSETTPSSDAIGRISVGQYQLHLVTTESPADEEVLIPRAVVEQSEAPHFYVLVEILEEIAQVRIYGFLQPEQLASRRQSLLLEDDAYVVPLDWFESNSSHLLLYLQHLEPAAFAAPILTHPPIHPSTPSLPQRAINAGLWLNNKLDQLAQDLSWVLLPPPLNPAMRSSSDQLDAVMSDLIARREIEIPPRIGNVYYDIQFGDVTLRLYILTWSLPRTDDPPEWILLLILGTPIGAQLPSGVKLQVEDETQLLANPTLSQDPYLYAQVRGKQNEQFYVTVSLDDQQNQLPPISFAPEVSL